MTSQIHTFSISLLENLNISFLPHNKEFQFQPINFSFFFLSNELNKKGKEKNSRTILISVIVIGLQKLSSFDYQEPNKTNLHNCRNAHK